MSQYHNMLFEADSNYVDKFLHPLITLQPQHNIIIVIDACA